MEGNINSHLKNYCFRSDKSLTTDNLGYEDSDDEDYSSYCNGSYASSDEDGDGIPDLGRLLIDPYR